MDNIKTPHHKEMEELLCTFGNIPKNQETPHFAILTAAGVQRDPHLHSPPLGDPHKSSLTISGCCALSSNEINVRTLVGGRGMIGG
jgi:hypothetical protein